jgi:hypothetical protein
MSWLLWFAKIFSPNFFTLARESNKVQLVTIAFSHYCEIAAWALHFGKVPVQEHAYSPGQHVLPVLNLRIGSKDKKYLSKSSRMKSAKEAKSEENNKEDLSNEERAKKEKRDTSARATAVPVAVQPNGNVLLDSWDIATSVKGLNTIDPKIKQILDEEIGPYSRQMVYSKLLLSHNLPYFHKLCQIGHGWFFRLCWFLFLGNQTIKLLKKMFDPYNTDNCREKLLAGVAKIEKILDERSGPYLNGQQVGLADIALASLFAPLVSPPNYYEGKFSVVFNELLEKSDDIREETEYWRKTKVGQYVLEIYAKHRM